MYHHFFYQTVADSLAGLENPAMVLSAMNNGWLGVSLFFVLSGLILYRPQFVISSYDFLIGMAAMRLCFEQRRAPRYIVPCSLAVFCWPAAGGHIFPQFPDQR